MQAVELEYGTGRLTAELPDTALVVRPGLTYAEPEPVPDPVATTAKALAEPHGCPPIRELVGPGSRVAIAFPDRVKGGNHDRAHRKVTIPLLLDELAAAGVREKDITLVCAVGLHRKNTPEEMADYLPSRVLDGNAFRVANHDAEDPDGIVDLGRSDLGDPVAFNRTCAEADLTILLGHVQGNPYGGFSGGHKTFTTGLTTWRSIAGHHVPATMGRPDFIPPNPHSHFRDQLRAIGSRIEAHLPQRLFVVDAVVGDGARILGTFAGTVDAVEAASWPLAEARTNVQLDTEPADVLVVGLPRDFHYGPGMGTNPILVGQAIAAIISRCAGAFRRDGVVVAAALADAEFNDAWFPSYSETFRRYVAQGSLAALDGTAEEMSTRREYVDAYRFRGGYHPFHAFSMLAMAELGRAYASRIYVAGARAPDTMAAMGFEPAATVEEGLRRAGDNPRILALPGFLTRVPPHLHATRDTS